MTVQNLQKCGTDVTLIQTQVYLSVTANHLEEAIGLLGCWMNSEDVIEAYKAVMRWRDVGLGRTC